MARNLLESDWKSPRKFSKQYFPDSIIRMMMPISTLHSVSPLQLSFGWVSSHGRLGITNPISNISPEVLSNSSAMASFCNFPHQKPILFAKASSFLCLHRGMPHALSLHYANYSIVTQNHPLHLCSAVHSARSIVHGCFANSHKHCYFQGSIRPVSQVTHSVVEQQIRRSKQAYHGRTSRRWDDGKVILSIDTFQPRRTPPYYSPSPNSFTLYLARQASHPSLFPQDRLFPHDRRVANRDDGSPFGESARLSLLAFWRVAGCFPHSTFLVIVK